MYKTHTEVSFFFQKHRHLPNQPKTLTEDSVLPISQNLSLHLLELIKMRQSRQTQGPEKLLLQISLDKTPDKMDKAYLPYASPEIFHNMRETYDMFAVDLWSFGISILNMLLGSIPFESPPNQNYYDQYVDRLSIRMRVARELGLVSDAALDFMHRLLYTNPGNRLTADQALERDWICSDDGYVHQSS